MKYISGSRANEHSIVENECYASVNNAIIAIIQINRLSIYNEINIPLSINCKDRGYHSQNMYSMKVTPRMQKPSVK